MSYKTIKIRHALLAVILASIAITVPALELQAQTTETNLALLSRPGHHAIIRHAIAPGTGDPSDFKVGDCATQRNLSQEGRNQSVALGEVFKAADIAPTQILSSAWCRTTETAELMDLGKVVTFESLNSVWTASRETSRKRTEDLIRFLKQTDENETLLMVTHAVNISALTGQSSVSGGGYIIWVQDGGIEIVGRITPP